jgi:CRP/FNR family transcriptional regulator, anaerobic regulatory protein
MDKKTEPSSADRSVRQGRREEFLAVFGQLFPAKEWPAPKLDEILAQARFRDLEAGSTLLREGQVCASVPFVIEGSIRVFKTADKGKEITLYRIERGQSCILSVGCGSSIKAFPASVVVERPTRAAFLPNEAIRRLFAEGEGFRAFVLDQYSRRMAEIVELVEEVAFRRVDERLAQWLLERGGAASIAGAAAAGGSTSIAATHQELADHVGTSREVVSRILKDWEDRGLIELSRGSVRPLPGFERLRST